MRSQTERTPTLYLIQHRDYSGAETSQEVVIRSDPIALVACPVDSPSEAYARNLGAATTPITFRTLRHSAGLLETLRSIFRGLAGAWDLRRVLRRHPERRAIYAIGIRAGLLAALAAAGTRRLIVWSVTDRLPPWPLRPLVRFIAILFPGQILCLSEYIASDLVRSSRALGARTFVVNPGVELERFSGRAVRPGAPVAGIVGHISRVKRTDLAIDIAKQVVDSEPAFKLRVIGSAQFHGDALGFERQLRARVENDPTVRGSVEFVGQQRDVASALEGCGLLLHCRPDEPFGMVVVEAMALGLPVVAPAAGGLLEIIEDGVSGLLFPPGDVRAAAACVRRLVADPGLAGRIGANARERVETRFTSARQLELTLELLSRRAAAATAEEHVD